MTEWPIGTAVNRSSKGAVRMIKCERQDSTTIDDLTEMTKVAASLFALGLRAGLNWRRCWGYLVEAQAQAGMTPAHPPSEVRRASYLGS